MHTQLRKDAQWVDKMLDWLPGRKDKEWVEKIKKRGWAKQGGKLIKEDVKVEEDVEKVVHHKKQLLRLLLPLAV